MADGAAAVAVAAPGPKRVVVAEEGVHRSLKFCFESDIVMVECAGPLWPAPLAMLFPSDNPLPPDNNPNRNELTIKATIATDSLNQKFQQCIIEVAFGN